MGSSEKLPQRIENAFKGLLAGETLKGLKKRGIKDVQVITRADFMAAVKDIAAEQTAGEGAAQKSSIQKRVELLLIEIERLRREKIEVEHKNGLAETERAELSGRLDQIINSGSKAYGEKVTVDDIRLLITEREQLGLDLAGLKTQSELARETYEEEMTNLRVTQAELQAVRDKVTAERDYAREDAKRLKSDLEASRTLAANHKRKTLEREGEITSLNEKTELLLGELEDYKKTIAERDQAIELLKNPPEPEEEADDPAKGRPGARPATRRMNRSRGSAAVPGATTGSGRGAGYNFSFNGKQTRSGRGSTNRRRRLS
jgi:hypothetical protein